MPELHQTRPPEAARGDGRSVMARVSADRPFRPYIYNGGEREPAAVIQARERHRALNAELERGRALTEEAMPDPAPGWEWYRELAEDDELAELAAERDRYQAAMAAAPGPLPAPPPVTAVARCRRCGYLMTAAGHRVMCDA